MDKLIITYIGDDFLGMPTYKDQDGFLLKDINLDHGTMALHTVVGDRDGDPNHPISLYERYKDKEIVVIGRGQEPSRFEKITYQLLGRLQMDCIYYLGLGNRCDKYLWAGSPEKQIKKMRELHASFSDEKKPEWLTLADIDAFEADMIKSP